MSSATVSGKSHEWAFVSGVVAVREVRMLPAEFFRQLLAEPHLEGVLRRLGDTVLHDRLHRPEDLQRADSLAAECYSERLAEVGKLCPSPGLADLLRLQQDFVSFKDFVKRRQMKLEVKEPSASRYPDQVWERLWAELQTDLPAQFQEAARRARLALQSAPGRPEVLDSAVDGVSLLALCEGAERLRCPFIADYYRRYDTAKGVEMLWRARALGADEALQALIRRGRQDSDLFTALGHSKEADWPRMLGRALEGLPMGAPSGAKGLQGVRAFVGAADEWLMAHARGARSVAFGPERVFGYLVGLEAELYNLKLAAAGRAGGIAPELLESRLRACYI